MIEKTKLRNLNGGVKMKLGKFFILIISVIFIISGCSTDKTVSSDEQTKPVKVQKLNETTKPTTLDYIGTIDTKEIKKYSFKSSGRISKIFVEKGQAIKKGEPLAQLDSEDLSFAVNAAKAQLDGAKAQYNSAINGATTEEIKQAELNVKKAQDGLEYAQKQYERTKTLYDSGAVSKSQLEQVELEKEKIESDLQIAKQVLAQTKNGLTTEKKNAIKAQMDQAKINYEQKQNMLDNAVIAADMDGYVTDLLYKEGEMVSAGYPVVLTRNKTSIVKVGVTSEDLARLKIGTKAIIKENDEKAEGKAEGKVVTIEDIPDQQTRTYLVEVELSSPAFAIGSIVDISFQLENRKGIWIPITSVMANGEDYVYIVENNKAVKKTVKRGELQGTNIFVEGLKDGEQLIIEGMDSITIGDKLTVQK